MGLSIDAATEVKQIEQLASSGAMTGTIFDDPARIRPESKVTKYGIKVLVVLPPHLVTAIAGDSSRWQEVSFDGFLDVLLLLPVLGVDEDSGRLIYMCGAVPA